MKTYEICGEDIVECKEFSKYELKIQEKNSFEGGYTAFASLRLLDGNDLLFPLTDPATGQDPSDESNLNTRLIYINTTDPTDTNITSWEATCDIYTGPDINSDIIAPPGYLVLATESLGESVSYHPWDMYTDSKWDGTSVGTFIDSFMKSGNIGDTMIVQVRWTGCTGCNGEPLPEPICNASAIIRGAELPLQQYVSSSVTGHLDTGQNIAFVGAGNDPSDGNYYVYLKLENDEMYNNDINADLLQMYIRSEDGFEGKVMIRWYSDLVSGDSGYRGFNTNIDLQAIFESHANTGKPMFVCADENYPV